MSEPQTYREWQELKLAKMHVDMLGKESVEYGPATGTDMCSQCRWFTEPWQGETNGYCNLVSGEILPSDTCNRFETVGGTPKQETTVAGSEVNDQPNDIPAESKLKTINTIKSQKKKSRQMKMLPKEMRSNYAFEWMLPHDIEADDFYLIKGVAATEGEFKSGDIFDKSNLAFGAGAMSTAAMQGIGLLDIDHYHEELPERYAKYGLEGVHGEIGYLIDAGISVNKVTDGDGKTKDLTQVEWVGYTTNKRVAELVDEGKFIGTSVEDWSRSADCDTDESGYPTGCSIEGSHFINLGLILDETPDSHATWVNRVTSDDLDKWKDNALKNQPQFIIMSKESHKLKDQPKKIWATMNRDARRKTLHDLTNYIDENGNFTEGKDGLFTYLTTDVLLDEVTAQNITDYLWNHPSERNSWQMEMMSAGDWYAWFGHLQVEAVEAVNANLRKVLKKHGIKCLTCGNEKKRAVHEPESDGTCAEGTTKNDEGMCEDDTTDSEREIIDMPEEGACPEGFSENNDGKCEKVSDLEYTIIDMPEDGCPEGFTPLADDDTKCTDEPTEEAITPTMPIIDMGRFLQELRKKHSISKEMEGTLTEMFGKHTLKKKSRSLRTALSVSSPIEKFAKSHHLDEHLEPINIDRALVQVANIINFNKLGKHQVGKIILDYRNALKTLKQLKKKDN